jgi:hypothetical protein
LKNRPEETTGLKTQSNVILDKDEELDMTDRVSTINVKMHKNISIKKNDNGKYDLDVGITNGNAHQYMFTITVDNREIYRSDLIPAGASLPSVELDDVDLDSGKYEAIVIFTVVSEKDNQTVMGSTGITADLSVSK